MVTGGAIRIGRFVARALALAGCHVIVHYRRSRQEAVECCRELNELGVEAWRIRADLSRPPACERLVREGIKRAGRIDILVNNAAVFDACELGQLSYRAFDAEFRINLYAPALLTRYLAEQAETGRIVNLLDRRLEGIDTKRIPYDLSKKALAEFTRIAALALAPRFTVNAVAPGAVLPPPGKPHSYLEERARAIPTRRVITPEEIARAVVFLASEPSITGQILFVDGGHHLIRESA